MIDLSPLAVELHEAAFGHCLSRTEHYDAILGTLHKVHAAGRYGISMSGIATGAIRPCSGARPERPSASRPGYRGDGEIMSDGDSYRQAFDDLERSFPVRATLATLPWVREYWGCTLFHSWPDCPGHLYKSDTCEAAVGR